MEAPTIEQLTTVAGVTIAVVAILAVLMPILNLSTEQANRFGPLLAVGVGIVIAIVATWTIVDGPTKQHFLSAVINGLFAGLAAVGTHQFAKKTVLSQPSS
jgi:uncharacterized YccA/Bax inhibitor family protein